MIYRPYIRSERYRKLKRQLRAKTAAAEPHVPPTPLAGGHQGRAHGSSEQPPAPLPRFGFRKSFAAERNADAASSKLML